MNKFKPPTGRIKQLKSDYEYRTGRAKGFIDDRGIQQGVESPWEAKHVKNFGEIKSKINLSKEKVFDIKNDGKPHKVKKETKADKLKKPSMKNAAGKIWHYH